MNKRTATVLPTAALALVVLAGCGASGQAAGTEGSRGTGGSTDLAPVAEKLTEEPGDEYARSVQTWSPYMELWDVDGQSVTYTQIDCLGQEETTTGTWADNKIVWDGDNPQVGAGPTSPSVMEPLTADALSPVGARESATSDIEGQLAAHVQKCEDAGETVGGTLLG